MPEIIIPNGKLRDFTYDDIEIISEMSQEHHIRNMYFETFPPATFFYWRRKYDEFVSQDKSHQPLNLIISQKEAVVGFLELIADPKNLEFTNGLENGISYDINFFIGREYCGRGIATQAVSAATTYAFNNLNANRLLASCFNHNKASRHILEKVGFTKLADKPLESDANTKTQEYQLDKQTHFAHKIRKPFLQLQVQ